MKAVILDKNLKMSIQDIPTPVPGENEVLIKVLACGICGTDRHILKGEYSSSKPVVLGHEFGGEITAIGNLSHGEASVKVGDIVSVDPNITCGKCFHCLNYLTKPSSHCENLQALGVTINGGYAESVLVPVSQIYKVAKDINPLYLGFVEPLACCIHGIDLAQIKGGEKVCILGGGAMGMLMVQLCALAGAAEVILVTRQAKRREVALATGATLAVDPQSSELSKVISDVDITFECAGVPETFEQSLKITRVGGKVVVLGIYPDNQSLPINLFDFVTRGLTIVGSYINAHTQGRAADLISSGKLTLDPLISKVVSLADVPKILSDSPGEGDIKYIVKAGEQ